MASYAPATSKKTNADVTQHNSAGTTLQAEDKRPEVVAQKKLQEAANNSAGVKQLLTYQAMADKSQQPLQMVLKPGESAVVEARLISEYHADETAGDNAADDLTAIQSYRDAIRKRRTVNGMHVAADQGHLDAIATIEGKIRRRQGAAAQRARDRANRAAQAAALEARNAGPPGGGAGAGAGAGMPQHLASWQEGGQPAWFPRKHGT